MFSKVENRQEGKNISLEDKPKLKPGYATY